VVLIVPVILKMWALPHPGRQQPSGRRPRSEREGHLRRVATASSARRAVTEGIVPGVPIRPGLRESGGLAVVRPPCHRLRHVARRVAPRHGRQGPSLATVRIYTFSVSQYGRVRLVLARRIFRGLDNRGCQWSARAQSRIRLVEDQPCLTLSLSLLPTCACSSRSTCTPLSIVAATLPPAGGQPMVERIESTEKAVHRQAGFGCAWASSEASPTGAVGASPVPGMGRLHQDPDRQRGRHPDVGQDAIILIDRLMLLHASAIRLARYGRETGGRVMKAAHLPRLLALARVSASPLGPCDTG
jgi:hypothetical protein